VFDHLTVGRVQQHSRDLTEQPVDPVKKPAERPAVLAELVGAVGGDFGGLPAVGHIDLKADVVGELAVSSWIGAIVSSFQNGVPSFR